MKKMWIKCNSESSLLSNYQIGVGQVLFNEIGENVWIKFGQRELLIEVKLIKEDEGTLETSFENPIILYVAENILSELLIEPTNVYQIKFKPGKIEIGPVIGLLLGEQQYYYHDSTMREYTDALSAYQKIGGLVYAFKTCSINWTNQCIHGLFFDQSNKKWKYSTFPIPSVIYRRAFNVSNEVVDRLNKAVGGKIFNSRRYSKWQMYQMLKKNETLKEYLPETARLKGNEILGKFLNKYTNVILKPIGLSRGRGICIMRKVNDKVFIRDYRDGTRMMESTFTENEAIEYIEGRKFHEKRYIIQPYIKLAKINGSPWDVRVVMQKDVNNEWNCHGIECRVAGMGDLVTNISRGGKALSLSEAVNQSFGPVTNISIIKGTLVKICKLLSEVLEGEDENLAELGIDIAMDVDQNFWIIESNVRPTYNGFKRHMRYENYLHLCNSPVTFASSMAGFGRWGSYETKA